MEHPFVNDIGHYSTAELSTKINELYNKLRIAMSSGNGDLCNQIKMVIHTYESKYQQKLKEENGGDDSYENNVDIS